MLTLKGIQEKNIFVDELGRSFNIVNLWTPRQEQYICIEPFDETRWKVIRRLKILRN